MDSKQLIHVILLYTILNSCIKQVTPVVCYVCEFNRNSCPVLGGCPQNRDRCSVQHFNRWTTPKVDCPGGCQTFLVTDPVGDVLIWKRGCSNQPPTGSQSNICTTEYVMGSYRVDSCVCNRYLCNAAPQITSHHVITIITSLFTLILAFHFQFVT